MEDFEKYKKPLPVELRSRLSLLDGWQIVNNRLEKQFKFENFARAMIFLNKIVNPIEEHQNYPRIVITYDRILISLFTNEAGAITFMDLNMAEEFDRLSGEKGDSPGFIKA